MISTVKQVIRVFRLMLLRACVALGLAAAGVTGCGGGGTTDADANVSVAQRRGVFMSRVAMEEVLDSGKSAPVQRDRPQAVYSVDTPTGFNGNGWYWNPAEGGTGFFIEAQGKSAYVGLFVYDDSGLPTWYAGMGTIAARAGGYQFTGALRQYVGGQPVDSLEYKSPTSSVEGMVNIAFSEHGTKSRTTVDWPGGRSMQAQRFSFGTGGPALYGRAGDPETGWYWNPAKAGQGWAVEVQGDTVFMVMYHYRADGSPTWNLVQGNIRTGTLTSGFNSYSGGQTLTGSYRAATQQTALIKYTLNQFSTCGLSVTYPGRSSVTLSRFRFGAIPYAGECRASYTPSLSNPDAGSTAVAGGGLEGGWASSKAVVFVSPQGPFYSIAKEFSPSAIQVYDWAKGTMSATSATQWRIVDGAADRDSGYLPGTSYSQSALGSYAAKFSIGGFLGGVSISGAYSDENARAVDLGSLQGRWSYDGVTLVVNESGAVTGMTDHSTTGSCAIAGLFTEASPGTKKNMFHLTLEVTAKPSATQAACKYLGSHAGLVMVTRSNVGVSSSVYSDSLALMFWGKNRSSFWTVLRD